jgi:SAM-dependent methyltransferase
VSTNDNREYALGANAAEIVRLGVQHRLWSAAAFALWERAGLRAGHTVLDIGCGPGYTSFDLAGVVTASGRVVAVDQSELFIEHLKQRRQLSGDTTIDARVGRSESRFDKETRRAYQRWVLCQKDLGPWSRVATRSSAAGCAIKTTSTTRILLSPRAAAPVRSRRRQAWRDQGGDTEVGSRLRCWRSTA